MAELKMPELNYALIAGNLTKDSMYRTTSNSTPVVNFSIASNRRYKDKTNSWQEDVCYVGVVAWNRLAESCRQQLRKGNAVLVEGELQTRNWKTEEGNNRSILEVKARRIQFLNRNDHTNGQHFDDDDGDVEISDDDTRFDFFDHIEGSVDYRFAGGYAHDSDADSNPENEITFKL